MLDPALLIEYCLICFAIALIDWKYRLIPDFLTMPGILLALAVNTLTPDLLGAQASLIGLIAGWSAIYIAGTLCFMLSSVPGLGGGDLKLLAMIGAFWGWKVALLTFALAPVFGGIFAMIFQVKQIPFGIFLIYSSFWGLSLCR